MGKLATFKWFTDNYTRGSWESGVSDNIFDTSRDNVSATSNKAINYNDLLNPSSYNYNGNNIGATTNKCVEETDITNLMRPINFTVDITLNHHINGTDIYFTNTDFDSNPEAIYHYGYPIKLEVTIGSDNIDGTTYNVNVDYQGSLNSSDVYIINHTGTASDVIINKVSVYRPNTTSAYILKPQITFNYATGLSVSVSGQAENFATVGKEITNSIPDDGNDDGVTGGGGGGTTGKVLTIDPSWKSVNEAAEGLSFEICWCFIVSEEDTNIYKIKNPETGFEAYVEDDPKEMDDLVGKYIAFYGEIVNQSTTPLFLSYEVRDWGDTYSLS